MEEESVKSTPAEPAFCALVWYECGAIIVSLTIEGRSVSQSDITCGASVL